MFLYEAYARIGVSIASLLYYCGPVIVMALSPILFKKQLTTNKILGFLAVVIDVVLINGNTIDGKCDLFGIACGLFNTSIGCYFYFSSIGKLKVQTVAICGYLEPLSAVLFSVIFLKETMLSLQIIGAVLIIGGAMCGELVKQKVHEL